MPVRVALMIELQRIDHVALRRRRPRRGGDSLVREQFGLRVSGRRRDRVRLSCDDEPCALELIAGESAGLDHVAYELAPGCSLGRGAHPPREFGAQSRTTETVV